MPKLFDTINNNISNASKAIKSSIKKKEKITPGADIILSQDYYDHSKPVKLSGLEYGYNSEGKFTVKGEAPNITSQLTDKIQKQFGDYAYIDGNYIKNKKTNRIIGLVNAKGNAVFIHKVRKRTLSEAHAESFDKQSHETHVMKQKEIDKKVSKTDNVGKALGSLIFTPLSMVSIPNIVAGVSEASKGNYTKALAKWTGTSELTDIENKGIFEASEGMSKWYDEHPVVGTLVNMGGDILSVVGAGKGLKNIKEVPQLINSTKASVTAAKEAAVLKGLARAQAKKSVSEEAQTLYKSLSKEGRKALSTLDKLAQKSTLTEKQIKLAEKANEILQKEFKRFSSNQKRLVAKEYIKGGKEELAHKTTARIMDMYQNPLQYAKKVGAKTGKFLFNVGKDIAVYKYAASPAAEWTLNQFNINPKDKAILKEAVAWPTTSLISRGLDRLTILGLQKGQNVLDWLGSKIDAKAGEGLARNTKLDNLGTNLAKTQNKIDNFQQVYSRATHPLLYTGHIKKDIIGNLSTTPKEALLGMGFGTLEEVNPELSKYAWLFPGIIHNLTHRLENGLKYNMHLNSGGAQTAQILKENLSKETTAYNGALSVIGKSRQGEGKRAADSDILTKFGGMADVAYRNNLTIPGFNHYTTLSVGNRYSNPYLRTVNEAKYIADKLYSPYKESAWETFRRSKGDAVDIFSPYSLKELNYFLDNAIRLPSQYVASDKTKLPSASSIKGTYTKGTKRIKERLDNGVITKDQADEALNLLKNNIIQKFGQFKLGKEYASKIQKIFQKDSSFETKLAEASTVLKEEATSLKNTLSQEGRLFGKKNKEFAQKMREYNEAVANGDKKAANKILEKYIQSISDGKPLMSLRQYLLSNEYADIRNHFTRQGDLILGKNINHVSGKDIGNLVYNWKGHRLTPSSFLIKDKKGIYKEFGLGSDYGGTGSGGNSEPGNTLFEQFRRALIKNSKYHLDVGAKSLPVVFSPVDISRTASGSATTNMIPAFYLNKSPVFNLPIQQKQNFFKNFIFNY